MMSRVAVNCGSEPFAGNAVQNVLCNSGATTLKHADAGRVTLVIPARNAANLVRHCLEAVVPLQKRGHLVEIIVVDDASGDETAAVAAQYPVTVLRGTGAGPGAARNVGWRAARTPLVWFIDADCVAEPDALGRLEALMEMECVAAVGGSYTNLRPDSWLASLIHEEIVERHRRMSGVVNFLATFNVLYRRDVLEEVGGFEERFRLAQDAELAFRVQRAGYQLRFEPTSRVGHFHATRLWRYLRTQARHGYYRVLLYLRHPDRVRGDDYSGLTDHLQPLLALAFIATAPLAAVSGADWAYWLCVILALTTCGTALPMTVRLLVRVRRCSALAFAPLSCIRSLARGCGLIVGAIGALTSRDGPEPRSFGPQASVCKTPVGERVVEQHGL